MRLMWIDFRNDLGKLHKDYRHPARVGCDTYERVFKIVRLKVYHRPIGGIEMVGLIVYRWPICGIEMVGLKELFHMLSIIMDL